MRRHSIPAKPELLDDEGRPEIVSARLIKWEKPGQVGVEFELKSGGGRLHARRVEIPEEVLDTLRAAIPWDGREPH